MQSLILKSLLVVGLAQGSALVAFAGGSSSVGPGNPSYKACDEVDGTMLSTTGDRAAVEHSLNRSFCVFKDGGAIDGWTLYRYIYGGDHAGIVNMFLNSQKPAAKGQGQCENLGGKVETEYYKYAGKVRSFLVCDDQNGGILSAAALRGGAQRYPQMARALNAPRDPNSKLVRYSKVLYDLLETVGIKNSNQGLGMMRLEVGNLICSKRITYPISYGCSMEDISGQVYSTDDVVAANPSLAARVQELSAKAFAILAENGFSLDNGSVVGAENYKLWGVGCKKVVYPGALPVCSLL